MGKPRHSEFLRRFTPIQPNLFAYVRAAGFGWNEAEDILQDAAVALWESYESYDPDRPFVAWAIGITRHLILKRRRAAGRVVVDSAVCVEIANRIGEVLQAEQARMAHEREQLAECLAKMPARGREVIRLRYRDRLGLKEIAQKVGRTYAATNMWLSRLRGKLLDCLSAARSEP